MKYRIVTLLIVLVLLAGAGLYYWGANRAKLSEQTNTTVVEKDLMSQSNSEGGVTVTVTPEGLSSSLWKFKVVFDTHAGSLDQDLAVNTTLLDDTNNAYMPVSWQGDPPGGHHREGVLSFNPITPRPSSVQFVIKGIGGIGQRTFKWILEEGR